MSALGWPATAHGTARSVTLSVLAVVEPPGQPRDCAAPRRGAGSEAYYQVLNRKHKALIEVLERVIQEELHAAWDRRGCQPPAPGQAPVTQRDLDDAVAGLIRDARQEFGRGGAR